MTSKQLKFYQLLKQINTLNIFSDNAKLMESIKQAIALDYNAAVEIWEFLIIENESSLLKDLPLATIIGDKIAGIFRDASESRYIKTVVESPVICRAVYQYNPVCFAKSEVNAEIASLMLAGKEDVISAVMGCFIKNSSNKITYGEFMKSLVEKIFIESLKKSANGKVNLSKKLTAILLEYINKIKTSEKALLTQRIKEVQ